MKNTKKGFTLIELLVVIAIIGILSAIGLVALNGAREKAKDAQARSDLAQMRTALALYFDDFSAYPGETTNLTADISHVANGSGGGGVWIDGAAVNNTIVTEYLSQALKSPSGTRRYGYISNSDADLDVTGVTDYAVFYNLESAGGLEYYCVLRNGTVVDIAGSDETEPSCANNGACSC